MTLSRAVLSQHSRLWKELKIATTQPGVDPHLSQHNCLFAMLLILVPLLLFPAAA